MTDHTTEQSSGHASGRSREPEWLPYRPTWSTADYHAQTHPGDRTHQSDAIVVPVVQLVPRRSPEGFRCGTASEACEVIVVAHQDLTDTDIWVSVTDDSRRGLTLTVESAWRIYAALGALLHRDFTTITLPPARPTAAPGEDDAR